ncbi:hypothetical protein CR512_13980 [Pseudomonas putida]|nr:hypothetical protein CR512_13980 [Pseudomonas putida]
MVNSMDISKTIKAITSKWQKQLGAPTLDIDSLEASIHQRLPADLRSFLQWSNGGNCKFKNIYIDLWPTGAINKLNQEYQIAKYLGSKHIGIGTDGGSTCIALDYTTTPPTICTFNLGDIDTSKINHLKLSFSETINMANAGALTDKNIYQ